MNKEQVKERIEQIKKGIDELATNHRIFVGRLAEAEFMLAEMEKAEECPAGEAAACEPAECAATAE